MALSFCQTDLFLSVFWSSLEHLPPSFESCISVSLCLSLSLSLPPALSRIHTTLRYYTLPLRYTTPFCCINPPAPPPLLPHRRGPPTHELWMSFHFSQYTHLHDVRTYTQIHMWIGICTYTGVCAHIHRYKCIYIHMYTSIHVHSNIYIYTYIHIYIYMNRCMYI